MIPVSDRWGDALSRSHQMRVRCEVWQHTDADTYVKVSDLPLAGGTVTLDLDSDMFGQLDVEVADPDMLAADSGSPLVWTYGHHLRLWFAVLTVGGWEEVEIDCSFLVVEAPTLSGMVAGRTVRCETPIRYVMDARLETPLTYGTSWQRDLATNDLIAGGLPYSRGVVWQSAASSTLQEARTFDRERWEAVRELAGDNRWLWPRAGAADWLMADMPDPQTLTSVFTVAHGVNLLAGTEPRMGRQLYNAVVAYNADDPAVWAAAYSDHPQYGWTTMYGRRPLFYASPMLTAATVQQAADTRLATVNGKAREVTVEAVCNPALQPGDRITMRWPSGLVEDMMVRRCEFPLVPGPMRLTCQGVGG